MSARLAVLSAEPGGPSVRHRWTRLAPLLAEAGLDLEVVELPKAGGARREAFARAGSAAVTVLQRRLLRSADFERLRDAARRLVYDFDDAMPFREPWRENPLSTMRGNRFLRSCSESDAVLAGSEELAALARGCGPRALFVAPTPVDPKAYGPEPSPRPPGGPARFGWIGSRSTRPYLDAVAPPLRAACAALPGAALLVVADEPPVLEGVPVEFVPWTEEGEAEALRGMDLGIMPLLDDPWSRGKCGFKLLQYAATGIPSVASPVGPNRAILEHGPAGLLASTPAEWEEALLRLARDGDLRARLGAAARRHAVSRWSVEVLGPPLARFLSLVAGGR
ncbi:MAG: glycosyltransferase [Planctomycetes bacterium]|nr:glycosyltransferase [Planctomycetota bacterium]